AYWLANCSLAHPYCPIEPNRVAHCSTNWPRSRHVARWQFAPTTNRAAFRSDCIVRATVLPRRPIVPIRQILSTATTTGLVPSTALHTDANTHPNRVEDFGSSSCCSDE